MIVYVKSNNTVIGTLKSSWVITDTFLENNTVIYIEFIEINKQKNIVQVYVMHLKKLFHNVVLFNWRGRKMSPLSNISSHERNVCVSFLLRR